MPGVPGTTGRVGGTPVPGVAPGSGKGRGTAPVEAHAVKAVAARAARTSRAVTMVLSAFYADLYTTP